MLAVELATGEHPFGSDPAAMLRRMTQVLEGRPLSAPGSWGPPAIDAIARRCMRAAPEERFRSGAELAAALRDGTVAVVEPPRTADAALWWWQFHQAAIAVALAAMPAAAWFLREWIGRPFGTRLFFAVLVLATVSITARMNLLFTSRVHPASLAGQRARVFPWVAWLDVALAGLMIAGSLTLDGRDAVAGFLLALVHRRAGLGRAHRTRHDPRRWHQFC